MTRYSSLIIYHLFERLFLRVLFNFFISAAVKPVAFEMSSIGTPSFKSLRVISSFISFSFSLTAMIFSFSFSLSLSFFFFSPSFSLFFFSFVFFFFFFFFVFFPHGPPHLFFFLRRRFLYSFSYGFPHGIGCFPSLILFSHQGIIISRKFFLLPVMFFGVPVGAFQPLVGHIFGDYFQVLGILKEVNPLVNNVCQFRCALFKLGQFNKSKSNVFYKLLARHYV